jgi:hypothetical protein
MVVENPGNGTDAYLRLASDIIDRWGQEPIFLEGLPQIWILIRESQEKNAVLRTEEILGWYLSRTDIPFKGRCHERESDQERPDLIVHNDARGLSSSIAISFSDWFIHLSRRRVSDCDKY